MAKFAQLWENHPTIKGDAPLLDTATYTNQCAINLSAALLRSGVDMSTYKGVWSWQEGAPKYAIRAEELAQWLARAGSPWKVEKYSGQEAFDKIEGRAGIMFFRNYYGPGRSGDHIDLWNGRRLTALTSWFRIHWRLSYPEVFSDYRATDATWFWRVL